MDLSEQLTQEDKIYETEQYIVVKIGNEQYGINILYIQNIVRMLNITRVPNSPRIFHGVVNLRGEIIPVMSIRRKFNLEEDVFTNSTRIIIISSEDNVIGLIVDEVLEVVQLAENQIDRIVQEGNDEKSKAISAVGKLEGQLITIFNIEALIGIEE